MIHPLAHTTHGLTRLTCSHDSCPCWCYLVCSYPISLLHLLSDKTHSVVTQYCHDLRQGLTYAAVLPSEYLLTPHKRSLSDTDFTRHCEASSSRGGEYQLNQPTDLSVYSLACTPRMQIFWTCADGLREGRHACAHWSSLRGWTRAGNELHRRLQC